MNISEVKLLRDNIAVRPDPNVTTAEVAGIVNVDLVGATIRRIVAVGPRETILKPGDFCILDVGAMVEGHLDDDVDIVKRAYIVAGFTLHRLTA